MTNSSGGRRVAQLGELCTCGRQAVTVFHTEKFGEVGWCGQADGGNRTGGCPFCGSTTKHPDAGRCPWYTVRPG